MGSTLLVMENFQTAGILKNILEAQRLELIGFSLRVQFSAVPIEHSVRLVVVMVNCVGETCTCAFKQK